MISPKTYFHNADRSKVVEEGDKDAKFLIVREGHEIPNALAEQYGFNSEKLAATNIDTKSAKPHPHPKKK